MGIIKQKLKILSSVKTSKVSIVVFNKVCNLLFKPVTFIAILEA